MKYHQSVTPDHRRTWSYLLQQQRPLFRRIASDHWILGSRHIDMEDVIDITRLNVPDWKLMPVYGKLDDDTFFDWLSRGIFCVNMYLRTWEERDYLPERCRWHDTIGHVPSLYSPTISWFLRSLGAVYCAPSREHDRAFKDLVAKVYWATIEFGLIRENVGVNVLGAGILSSPAELAHVMVGLAKGTLDIHTPNLLDIATWNYPVDTFQDRYYLVTNDSFEKLIRELWQMAAGR